MGEIALKYESVLIVGKLGGWEYHIYTNELFCSHEYFALLGRGNDYPARWAKYSIKEVWEDLIHPDDVENAKNFFANYLLNNDGSLYEQKFRLKHADGHYLNILSRAKPLLENENSKFSGIIVGVHIDVTELMYVKEELADSKKIINNDIALLNSIINSPKDIYIIALDKFFRYTAISEGYYEHAQYFLLQEPLIGMSVFEVLPKELHESAKMNYERALSGESFSKKNEVLSKNGELFYYQNRYSPILDMNGEVTGISMFINDITSERKMAESTNRSELRYKALFDGANDAVFIAEAQTGFIVDVNDIACELMGKTKEELVGIHQSELHPPEELNMIKEQFEIFSKTDGYKVFYCSALHKSGKRIPVRISGTKPFLVEGKLFTAGFFHDCTNENDAKNLALELTELLSKAEGIAHLGSIEVNLISGERIWSDEFYHILGLKNSTISPDQDFFFRLIHPDDQVRFDEWYQASLNNIGESVPIEIRLTSVDGLDKNLLVTAFTNFDATGKLTKYISVVKDVTNETLTLNALRKQNKQLKEIAWAQSQLVRAPLSRMLGLINLMQKGILKREEEIEFLGHIKDSAEELDTVIKDVVYKASGIEQKLN